jgi:hypothetical protein
VIDKRIVSPHIYRFILPFYLENIFILFDESIQSAHSHYLYFSGSIKVSTCPESEKDGGVRCLENDFDAKIMGGNSMGWLISGYNSILWMTKRHFAHFFFRH